MGIHDKTLRWEFCEGGIWGVFASQTRMSADDGHCQGWTDIVGIRGRKALAGSAEEPVVGLARDGGNKVGNSPPCL